MGKLWLSPAETAVVNDLIEMFPAQWKQATLNPRLIGWFVGQVMLSSDGRFDANRVRLALVERAYIELFLHGEAVTP